MGGFYAQIGVRGRGGGGGRHERRPVASRAGVVFDVKFIDFKRTVGLAD